MLSSDGKVVGDWCGEMRLECKTSFWTLGAWHCHMISRIWDGKRVWGCIQYEDDEGDRVLLGSDSDLIAAVNFARISGWKVSLSRCFGVRNVVETRVETIFCRLWSYFSVREFFRMGCLPVHGRSSKGVLLEAADGLRRLPGVLLHFFFKGLTGFCCRVWDYFSTTRIFRKRVIRLHLQNPQRRPPEVSNQYSTKIMTKRAAGYRIQSMYRQQ